MKTASYFQCRQLKKLEKAIKELVQRLQTSNNADNSGNDTQLTAVGDSGEGGSQQRGVMQTINEVSDIKMLSIQQEFQLAIQASTCEPVITPSTSTSQELTKIIRQEMTLFENGGMRGRCLQLA